MYDSDNYLYANPLDRYAIGNRTPGLVYAHNGSLTFYLQHSEPASGAARANWLPAPTGTFHMILRLYEPSAAALNETWKPPPAFRAGEVLRPVLGRLRVAHRRLRYTDSQAASIRFTHDDRPGTNRVALERFHLTAGHYRVSAQAVGVPASYDNRPGRSVSRAFTVG
jgi:hypothetical protein